MSFKYPNLQIKLENKSTNYDFHVDIIHYSEVDFAWEFSFENSTYWIERGLLNFTDENDIGLKQVELLLVNPMSRKNTIVQIDSSRPFIYEVKGEIADLKDKVLIRLKAVSYLFTKGKNYKICLQYGNKRTNILTLNYD